MTDTIKQIRHISGHSPQELVLVRTGETIARGFYLGDQAIRVPRSLESIVPTTQAQRSRSNDGYLEAFVEWFRGLGDVPGSVVGEPIFRRFMGHGAGRGTA